MKNSDISYNFSIAKVASILMVVIGHYFGGILWIPTTFSLFVFAFSSGYFTSNKYRSSFDLKKFWHAKIVRLSYPLLTINLFLLIIFIAQRRVGIVSWQTLPSILGVSGFFTWFGINNPSPFGAGLWFFTLLLLFYLFYPLLSKFNQNHAVAVLFLLACLLIASTLNYMVPMGHGLWITAFAFIFGNYTGKYGLIIDPRICIIIFCISCSLLVALNIAMNFNNLNYFFILFSSISIVAFLLNSKLPNFIINKLLLLSGCVMQIYFIHTYLFVHEITKYTVINFMISIIIIIFCAMLLNKVTSYLCVAMQNIANKEYFLINK